MNFNKPILFFSMAQLIPSKSAYNTEKNLANEGILDSLDKSQYKSGHTDNWCHAKSLAL